MSEKKDWTIYRKHGVPVESFFLFANAAKIYCAANGVVDTSREGWAAQVTEELCEEWLAHNPSEKIREALSDIFTVADQDSLNMQRALGMVNEKRPKPLGAMAPPMQQAPALCGHQSDPDPHGTRHTCIIANGHIGQHQDQEWSWFPTDWRPTRKTL